MSNDIYWQIREERYAATMAALAAQLDDAEYEALARLCRSEESEVAA